MEDVDCGLFDTQCPSFTHYFKPCFPKKFSQSIHLTVFTLIELITLRQCYFSEIFWHIAKGPTPFDWSQLQNMRCQLTRD
jgi:hypothetical protein